MGPILFPLRRPEPILFLKAIKSGAGYALYGHPPRWHKVGPDKPAPSDAQHVATSHYHALAVKKLKGDPAFHALSHADQVHKVKGLAAEMQSAASASAAVSQWKKAMISGKNPTPAQWKAFNALPTAKQAELLQEAGKTVEAAQAAAKPSLVGKPAYDHIAQAYKVAGSTVEDAKAAASAWLAENPDGKDEMAEALGDLHLSGLAEQMGLVEPASPNPWTDAQWSEIYLPPTNTNAPSHNKKIDALKNAADAGDVAAIQAMKFGSNTYGKKQAKVAEHLIAAMGGGKAVEAAPKVVSVAAKPAAQPAASTSAKSILIGGIAFTAVKKPNPHNPKLSYWIPMVQSTGQEIDHQSYSSIKGMWDDLAMVAKIKGDKFAENLGIKDAGGSQPAPSGASPAPAIATGAVFSFSSQYEKMNKGEWKVYNQDADHYYMHKIGAKVPNQSNSATIPKAFLHDAIAKGTAKPAAATPSVESVTPKAAPKPQAGETPAHAITLHNTDPGHSKFWSAWVDGSTVTTKYGKIGAKGQTTVKEFSSPDAAKSHLVKQVSQKIGKGYYKDSGGSGLAPGGAAVDAGPKEGDTKQGADGMLVLKNGRWVKVDKGKPATGSAPPSIDGWQQIGPQQGSNPGGLFQAPDGTKWYCKFPADPDVAKSEVLAGALYEAAGIPVASLMLVTQGGTVGIASKWQDGLQVGSPAQFAAAKGAHAGFAADAWLANWDVVGLGNDNLQIGPDGKALRVDVGGSLEYRAQGAKKDFGPTVTEIDSLRDAKTNPKSAAVFGKMKKADIVASVAKVAAIPDEDIKSLVNMYGPGSQAQKDKLAATLIARKADLIKQYPAAAKKKAPKKPVFKPEKISEPPNFMNWGGSGKPGPSSKDFINAANNAAVTRIYEAAKTGNPEKIKALSFPVYNKDTGEVSGTEHVLQHPSQHVKGFAQQALNEIHYQLNPPKRFRFEGGHPLHALNASYPTHKGAQHGASVAKVAKFISLGDPGILALANAGLPEKITYQSGKLTQATYSPAAKAAFSKMPQTQKQALKAYTGSGYHAMNSSLWAGNPAGEAKAAAEALHTLGHDIQPGTVLSRKLSVNSGDLHAITGAVGKVLQEPAIMSASIRPSSWGGNVHLKMHVGPGVKGLWVGKGSTGGQGSLSHHGGEDEMILPPNTRLLILSSKKSSAPDADGFGGPSMTVVEAILLPTQA